MEVKELLDRHVTTTQIYDKRRRAAREGASHKMHYENGTKSFPALTGCAMPMPATLSTAARRFI
jgi:hypothetical protein